MDEVIVVVRRAMEERRLRAEVQALREEVRTKYNLSKEALRLLLEYDWPGKVQELENVIERAVILGAGPAPSRRSISTVAHP